MLGVELVREVEHQAVAGHRVGQPLHHQPAQGVPVRGEEAGLAAHHDATRSPRREHVVDHQLFVEQALHELHGAGWIAKDPGKVDAVYDAATKAAVEDFQTQFKVEPIDGKPGAITRAALKRVLDDLHAGKPNPNKPEEHRPRVDHFYWLRNRVLPGGSNKLAIHGANLDTLVTLKITLTDENGARERLSLPRIPEADRAVFPLTIPATLARGAKLTARLEGSGKDGTTIDKSSKVPLYLEAPI